MSPLVLDQPALERIHRALLILLRESEAKCAVLVDQDGQCITKKGFTRHLDTDSLAALVAGSFASTRAMAKLVGENEFTVLFNQGQKDSIHNILVDDDTILSLLFDDRTTIGMVRLYSKVAAEKISEVLKRSKATRTTAPVEVDLGSGAKLGRAAADRLEDLFSEGK